MRASSMCIIALLPLLAGGCAGVNEDLSGEFYTVRVNGDGARPAAGLDYATYTAYGPSDLTAHYDVGFTPYYYSVTGRTPSVYNRPYYYRYREYYPSPRFYRPPGYRTFPSQRYPRPPYDRYDSRRFDPFERFDRYPYERFDRYPYDRHRYNERGSYDRRVQPHRSAPRRTYRPPGNNLRFRGDHFDRGGATPRGGSGSIPRGGTRAGSGGFSSAGRR